MNLKETLEFLLVLNQGLRFDEIEAFFQEKNIVYGNIIYKDIDKNYGIAQRLSIGYLLPDNQVYDFIDGNIYEQIFKEGINNKDGDFFYILTNKFKNSNRKLSYNKQENQIDSLIKQHIEGFKTYFESTKIYNEQLNTEEFVHQKYVKKNVIY